MKGIDQIHVVPLTAPVSITAENTSDYFNMGKSQGAKIIVSVGSLTPDLAITVLKGTTTVPGASAAIPFRYRKSAAVGTDTMGAWTQATTSGVTLTGTTDNDVVVEILLESSEFTPVSGVEYPYGAVVLTPSAGTACLVAVTGIFEPRYAQAVPPSQVA